MSEDDQSLFEAHAANHRIMQRQPMNREELSEAKPMTESNAKTFSDGFDAGQNEALSYIGPMLDEWDRLSNDEKGQALTIAPLFVARLEKLKAIMDRQ